PADAAAILEAYQDLYDEADDQSPWFDKVKSLCAPFGYTPNVKEWKQDPEAFKGHVGHVSTVIRVAVTSRTNTPDLCAIMGILGKEECLKRLQAAADYYRKGN
ncbi:MAG: glutamate--tRNA ligase, partial [Clostridia bacterium]|nr:glutamate--tRNA ligase [Clostridia bacterium]